MQITLNFSSEAVDVLERFIAAVGVAKSEAEPSTTAETAETAETKSEEPAAVADVADAAKESAKSEKPSKKTAKQPDLSAIKSAIKESPLDKGRILDLMKIKFGAEKVTDIPQERWSEFIIELGTAV